MHNVRVRTDAEETLASLCGRRPSFTHNIVIHFGDWYIEKLAENITSKWGAPRAEQAGGGWGEGQPRARRGPFWGNIFNQFFNTPIPKMADSAGPACGAADFGSMYDSPNG